MRLFGLIGYPLTHSFSKKYFTEKFEKAGFFKNGRAEVKKDGEEYIIDKTGKRVD